MQQVPGSDEAPARSVKFNLARSRGSGDSQVVTSPEASFRLSHLPMTDFLHPWLPPPFAGHLQKSLAKLLIINAVGKSHDAITRVVVHFFVRNRDTHAAPLHFVPA